MLPLWRKELRIVLCPNKVVVIALNKGLRRKVLLQAILPVIPDSTSDWHAAMAVLEQWLTDNDLNNANLKVLLSSSFLRYAMMPFSDGLSSYSERLAVAGLILESIYGETATQWKLTLDDDQYDKPCLISAMDSELWDALKQMSLSRQLKMISIQPYATSIRNLFSNQIQDGDNLLVVLEDEHAVLIETRNKSISGVRKTTLDEDSGGLSVIDMLHREMLISGLSEETAKIYLHDASDQDHRMQVDAGMDIVLLRDENMEDPSQCSKQTGYEMVRMKESGLRRVVDLDFYKTRVRVNVAAGLLLLFAGLLASTSMVVMHKNIKVEQQRIQLELTQQQNENLNNFLSSSTDSETKQQLQRAASIIEQLSFPWNKLFYAIEENVGNDIALLSVRPDMPASTVELDAEAKNWGAMVSYIKRLEKDSFFSDVHLVSHQNKQSDPQRPVRFKLSCAWGT